MEDNKENKNRGSCDECGEGFDNEAEWLYNTHCEVCGEPIPEHLIVKKPSDFKIITQELVKNLTEIKFEGDLSDIGNEVGYVIGKFISDKQGYSKEDFINGLKHGISISDGTHP